MSIRNPNPASPLPPDTLDSAWRKLHSAAPAEPPLEHMLRAATARQPRSATRRPALVWRVAMLVCSVAVLTAALQIAASRLPGTARLTPLRQINPAWSAADGYVLEFTVYDLSGTPAIAGSDPPDPPNFAGFRAAALRWADRHGFDYLRPYTTLEQAQQLGFRFSMVGKGNWPGAFSTTRVQIDLRSDSPALATDLASSLSALPGVAQPEVSRMSFFFSRGGMTPALEDATVSVNGTRLRFPEDLTPAQAQDVYYYLTGAEPGRPTYFAFRKDLLAEPDGTSRFDLGDVVRIGLDEDGTLNISTVLKHWDAPHGAGHRLTAGVSQGWGFTLPPGIAEADIDPVLELSRRFAPLPGDKYDLRYIQGLSFWLVPREQFFSTGSAGITAEQAEAADKQAAALQQALDAWKAAHPAVRRSLAWGDRVRGETLLSGPHALLYCVRAQSDDMAELDSLGAALSAVPGAPSAQVDLYDRRDPASH